MVPRNWGAEPDDYFDPTPTKLPRVEVTCYSCNVTVEFDKEPKSFRCPMCKESKDLNTEVTIQRFA